MANKKYVIMRRQSPYTRNTVCPTVAANDNMAIKSLDVSAATRDLYRIMW